MLVKLGTNTTFRDEMEVESERSGEGRQAWGKRG